MIDNKLIERAAEYVRDETPVRPATPPRFY
jgi:hypothetical protein